MYFDHVDIINKNGLLNNKWRILFENKVMTTLRIDVGKKANFFTIGSCFAEYVRKSLEEKIGQNCYPHYHEILFDSKNSLIDTLNQNNFHMNHYSSTSILQEFRRSYENDQDFLPIEVKGLTIEDGQKKIKENSIVFQDPYRREVYAKTKDECVGISNKVNDCVKKGLIKSNVFIITLGLIEIFKCKITGKVFNQYPGYMGVGYDNKNLEFQRLNYEDILKDLKEIILFLKKININNKIIFSVSPVPLQLTFSKNDIFSANIYSKSILRSAVENVISTDEGVFYFPSYELALNIGSDFFQARDLRHAKKELVSQFMDIFLATIDFTEIKK